MMEIKDITQISISSEASYAADMLMESGYFKDKADILTFAAAYMVKNHYKSFDPATYTLQDSQGSNFSSSTFDPERKWYDVVRSLYEDTATPYLYLRALMDRGLLLIIQRVKGDPDFSITDELQ